MVFVVINDMFLFRVFDLRNLFIYCVLIGLEVGGCVGCVVLVDLFF